MQPWAFTTFLAAQFFAVLSLETHVQMHKDTTENNCGKVIVLGPGHDVRVSSNGQAPNGYCGVSMFTARNVNNFTCDAICVTFKTASTSTCEVKVKFIGHKFRKEGDLQKAFDCHHTSREPFCWPVNSMRVEVIESYNYAYVWDHKPTYSFDIDVSARCTKDPLPMPAYYSSLDEKKVNQTYVEGLVVGLSLAFVFLIILFITYCYYKHKATNNAPAPETPKKARKPKPNILTTFRAKLPIGSGRSRSAEKDEPQPSAVYRKTGSTASTVEVAAKRSPEDPEVITELSPLTAEINEEKQPEFEEAKLVITNETDEDLKKLKSAIDKTKDTADSKQEQEVTCDTPDVVVHSGTTESADGNTEHGGESENA